MKPFSQKTIYFFLSITTCIIFRCITIFLCITTLRILIHFVCGNTIFVLPFFLTFRLPFFLLFSYFFLTFFFTFFFLQNNIQRKATIEKRQRNQDFLKSVKILSSLNNYERGRLSDALSEKVVKAGEIVVNEGDDGDDFYLIQAGEFAVTKKGVEGEVSIRLTKGMYFGEVALLTQKPRTATVKSVTDGVLLEVHRDAFAKLLGPLNDILERNMEHYQEYKHHQEGSTKK